MRLFRSISRRARPVLVWATHNLIKAYQFPRVLGEFRPKYISDETIHPATGGVYCIFLIYGAWGFQDDTKAIFAILRDAGVNIIAIVNGTIASEDLMRLKESSHRVIRRHNQGHDFGGYRAASLKLYEENPDIERLLYFNDSVYYINGDNLRNLVHRMVKADGYDFVGTVVNHMYSTHFCSFALSLSGEVFYHDKIRAFWRTYRTYDLKEHAIHAGEIGLNRVIRSIFTKMDVLFSLDKVSECLYRCSYEEVVDSMVLLPPYLLNTPMLKMLKLVNRLVRTDRFPELSQDGSLSSSDVDIPDKSAMPEHTAGSTQSSDTANLLRAKRNVAKQALITAIIREMSWHNPMHFSFGYLRKFLSIPLIKKDLYYSQTFLESQLPLLFSDLSEEEKAHVMHLLMNRGRLIPPLYFGTRLKQYLRLI